MSRGGEALATFGAEGQVSESGGSSFGDSVAGSASPPLLGAMSECQLLAKL